MRARWVGLWRRRRVRRGCPHAPCSSNIQRFSTPPRITFALTQRLINLPFASPFEYGEYFRGGNVLNGSQVVPRLDKFNTTNRLATPAPSGATLSVCTIARRRVKVASCRSWSRFLQGS